MHTSPVTLIQTFALSMQVAATLDLPATQRTAAITQLIADAEQRLAAAGAALEAALAK